MDSGCNSRDGDLWSDTDALSILIPTNHILVLHTGLTQTQTDTQCPCHA
jgi:hypothetical protein